MLEIPAHEATLIQVLALMSFASATYGAIHGLTVLPFWTYGVGITTLLYWSDPVRGWRRATDMTWTGCALIAHLIWAWFSRYWLQYYLLVAAALGCYPVSNWLHERGHISAGIAVHGLLHVLANAGNYVLYAGLT